MALDEPKANESSEEIDGFAVLFDAQIKGHAAQQVLDYVVSPRGEGFVIKPVGGGCC